MTHQRISYSYYIALIDYGPNYTGKKGPSGLEALPVSPETTRRQLIEEIRDVQQRGDLIHVKLIDGNYCCDVTHEILAELDASADRTRSAATAWAFDHARALRQEA